MEDRRSEIVLEVLLAMITSNIDDKSKYILTEVAKSIVVDGTREKAVIQRLSRSFKQTKEWPSYEFVVQNFKHEYRQLEIEFSVGNSAEAVSVFESEIERHQRLDISDAFLNLSRLAHTESFEHLRNEIGRSTLVIEKNAKDDRKTLRERYRIKKAQPSGILTFIKSVDKEMGGVRKGTMMTLAAFTGHLKTRTLISMMYKNAVECRQNGVMISLEMLKDFVWSCLLSRHSMDTKFSQIGRPVPSKRIIDTQLSDEEEEFIYEVVEKDLRTNPEYGKIEVLDRSSFTSMSFPGIRSKLLSLPFDLDYLTVDYIQLFKFLDEAKVLSDPGNQYMGFFRELSVDFDGKALSVVVLSQINRSGYVRAKGKGGEYDLFDLAELNAIERDSAYVVTLFLDENLKESGEIKINMPKNRYGDCIVTPIISLTNPAYCVVGDELDEIGTLVNEDDMLSVLGEGGIF